MSDFLFDDYFSDDQDKGVEILVQWKGKSLPFRIKRVLTLAERKRANDAAMKINLDKNGKPQIVGGLDQAAFTTEVVLVGLKAWPFKYSNDEVVPINRQTVGRIDAGLADEIASRVLGIAEVANDEAAPDPFVPESEED